MSVPPVFTTQDILNAARKHLDTLPGHLFDVLTIAKPVTPDAAVNLVKVLSKLSPIVGNLIEFNTCEFLNDKPEFNGLGTWKRQDPGFPDVIFDGSITPRPGLEIKAWFPFATEITARFKDSQNHFTDDRTYVALLAWLPEYVIFGKPQIIGVATASGQSVAKARDDHYHNPPDYIVREPEDTSTRTANLQQTNTNGYKWQSDDSPAENAKRFEEATAIVASWGSDGKTYSPTPEYQRKLAQLMGKFSYRGDTNYAKMDRIGHAGIQSFAESIYAMEFRGMRIGAWNRLLRSNNRAGLRDVLSRSFNIEDTSERLIK